MAKQRRFLLRGQESRVSEPDDIFYLPGTLILGDTQSNGVDQLQVSGTISAQTPSYSATGNQLVTADWVLNSGASSGGTGSGVKPITRCAIIGGSMGAYNFNVGVNNFDMDSRGVITSAQMFLGGALDITNFAVPGSTSQNVIDSQLSQLTPGLFDYVFVFTGGNDLLTNVPTDIILSNVRQICTYIKDIAKAQTVLLTIPPYNQSLLTAAQFRSQNRLNQAYLNTPKVYGDAFVYDMYADLIDPTSTTNAFKSGMSYDSIHTVARGAMWVGSRLAKWLQDRLGIIPKPSTLSSITDTWTTCGTTSESGVNLCDTGASFFQGTSGTTNNLVGTNPCSFSGTVPGTSASDRLNIFAHSQSVAGMSVTMTTATDTDQTPYFELAVTTSTANQYVAVIVQNLAARAVDQKWYESEAYVKISGTNRPAEAALITSMAADQSIRSSIGFATVLGSQGFAEDYTLNMLTPRKQYLNSYGVLNLILRFTFVTAGTSTIRIKLPAVTVYDSQTGI